MKIKAKNNKAVIFLLIVTLAVWGAILYNVIKYYKSRSGSEDAGEILTSFTEEGLKASSVNKSSVESYGTAMQYKSLDRDPFRMEKARPKEDNIPVKKSSPHEEKLIPVKPRLNYKISGVIINKGNKLVVFEDVTGGKTLFLREGDTYKDITIESVLMDKVTLSEDGLTKEIMLQK